jgi:hypothetical protein
MSALEQANETPGLEVAIYELYAVACAKVGKAKVRKPTDSTRVKQ